MKRAIFLCVLSLLTVVSFSLVNAQSLLNLENLNRPEAELIIGLNHPKNSNTIQLELQIIDEANGIDLDSKDSSSEDKDDLDDILDDYLDDLEDEDGGEPDLEELILERLKNPNLSNISLYPNPATNFINVNVDNKQNYELEVYDLIGNLVLAEKSSNISYAENRLDINNLQKGVYIMHIITSAERFIKKFGVN